MNGFYEDIQDNIKTLYVQDEDSYLFPAHFHHKIEIFILKKGFVSISCNGKSYDLTDGSIAFFNSYDMHSYDVQDEKVEGYCIIIPSEYSARFTESIKNKQIKCPVIKDASLIENVYSLTKTYLASESNDRIKNNCIELILSLIESKMEFTLAKTDNETAELVKKILTYIYENFKEDASLKTISKKLGYSNAHISRVFGKYIKNSIPDYVNELRLNEVNNLIKNTNANVTDIVFQAGFKSLQTYYRFKSKKNKIK